MCYRFHCPFFLSPPPSLLPPPLPPPPPPPPPPPFLSLTLHSCVCLPPSQIVPCPACPSAAPWTRPTSRRATTSTSSAACRPGPRPRTSCGQETWVETWSFPYATWLRINLPNQQGWDGRVRLGINLHLAHVFVRVPQRSRTFGRNFFWRKIWAQVLLRKAGGGGSCRNLSKGVLLVGHTT